MFVEFLVLLIGMPLLWLWCRRDARREQTVHDRSIAVTTDLRRSVDRLIQAELDALPPAQREQWLRRMRARDITLSGGTAPQLRRP